MNCVKISWAFSKVEKIFASYMPLAAFFKSKKTELFKISSSHAIEITNNLKLSLLAETEILACCFFRKEI